MARTDGGQHELIGVDLSWNSIGESAVLCLLQGNKVITSGRGADYVEIVQWNHPKASRCCRGVHLAFPLVLQ
jgi:hypothetical protein